MLKDVSARKLVPRLLGRHDVSYVGKLGKEGCWEAFPPHNLPLPSIYLYVNVRLLGGKPSQQPSFPILPTYDTSCRPSKRGTSLRAETSLGIKTDIHIIFYNTIWKNNHILYIKT